MSPGVIYVHILLSHFVMFYCLAVKGKMKLKSEFYFIL